MARESDAPPESDRLPGFPHPRERDVLIGHEEAEAALTQARQSGRLHHAWILAGPEGIGKATLAYRFAKALLGERDGPAAIRLIQQNAHPDLLALRRPWDAREKRAKGVLGVDEIRRLRPFFGASAGQGGWRVAIVDSADDLNASAANALLKILEEPPARSLLLLVAHRPGRLLATLRSRCRMLRLGPLSRQEIGTAVDELLGAEADAHARAFASAHAEGSLRRALVLAQGRADMLRELVALLDALPRLDERRLHELVLGLSARGAEGDYELALDLMRQWLWQRVRRQGGQGAAALAPYAEVWNKVARLAAETEAFNLDRRQSLLVTFSALAEAAREGARRSLPAA